MKLVSFLIASVFLLLSCQTTPKKLAANDVDPVLWYDLSWFDSKSIPAKNVYISVTIEPGVPESLIAESNTSKTQMEKWFQDNGYTLAKSRAKADFWIDLTMGMVEDLKPAGAGNTSQVSTVNETRTRVINGTNNVIVQQVTPDKDGRTYDYNLVGGVQEYGKRLSPRFFTNGKSGSTTALADRLRAVTPQWLAEFGRLQVVANPGVKKLKKGQDPGCTPRFGFEHARRNDGESFAYVIYKVLKNSGADKAGAKVGDVILGVDSLNYEDLHKNHDSLSKIYEQRIAVPIKLLRGDKEIRSSIMATIDCKT